MGDGKEAARITSIEINEGFNNGYYDPFAQYAGLSGVYSKSANQGTQGYALDTLPIGTKLNTDARWVVLVGPNGCGKSTLIQKLEYQLRFEDNHGDFLNVDYRASNDPKFSGPPSLSIITHDNRDKRKLSVTYNPSGPGAFVDIIVQARAILSSGEIGRYWIDTQIPKDGGWAKTQVITFDEPEKNLDILNIAYTRDRLWEYCQRETQQLFIATHDPAFLDVPNPEDAIVINFFDPNGARSVPLSEFNMRDYVRPVNITDNSSDGTPGTMIKSVRINPDFHNFEFELDGEPSYSSQYEDWQSYAQGLDGYAVTGLPVGTTLNTDNQFVVLFGLNGSGKSSLLHKLEAQYTFSDVIPTGDYVDVQATGNPKIHLYRTGEQAQYGDEEKNSSGQHNWSQLLTLLEGNTPPEPGTILFLDEPEQRLDVLTFPRVIEQVYDYALSHNIQVFIATQKPDYLSIDCQVLDFFTEAREDGLVHSLRGSDFDLEQRLSAIKERRTTYN